MDSSLLDVVVFLLFFCSCVKQGVGASRIRHHQNYTDCPEASILSTHFSLGSPPLSGLLELEVCDQNGLLETEFYLLNCSLVDGKRNTSLSQHLLDASNMRKRRESLLYELQSVLGGLNVRKRSVLLYITVVNKGYMAMFYNWLCSVEAHLGVEYVEKHLKQNTLIFSADDVSTQRLNELGFHVVTRDLYLTRDNILYLDENKTKVHALRRLDHQVVQKSCLFALASDILALGYSFLAFDSDVVWRSSPDAYFFTHIPHLDFLVSWDGRFPILSSKKKHDLEAPLNSGVLFGRSTCRSSAVLEALIANADLINDLGMTDQGLFNLLLFRSPKFRLVRLGVLAPLIFVNGNTHHRPEFEDIDFSRVVLIHASWAQGLEEKVDKLSSTGDWFWHNKSRCSYARSNMGLLS